MAYDKLMIKKWAAALNEFSQKTNGDFMRNPQEALKVLQPGKYRAFESVLRAYLKDCGVYGFLGECDVARYNIYTEGLFSGRKELAIVTWIGYGHWNDTPKDTIRESWLMSTANDNAAVGLLVKLTDGPDKYRYIIAGRKKEDTWLISHEEWESLTKKTRLYLPDQSLLISYTLLHFLMPDLCPANPGKLNAGRMS